MLNLTDGRPAWRLGRHWAGWLALAAVIFAAAACDPAPETAPPEDFAPDFELTLFENENHQKGEIFALSEVEGPAVVNFWFPSCPPCVAEMPDFEEAFQAHKSDGIQFVGVQLLGLDTAADGQAFIDDIGVTYAVGPDETGDIVTSYEITGFPSTVFIDGDQRITRKWNGFLDAEKIEELIQELLAGDSAS